MADCNNCGAWFHYEDGSTDGVWLLLIIGPCAGFPPTLPGPLPSPSGTIPFIAFDPGLNPGIEYMLGRLNRFGVPIQIALIADTLWSNGLTVLPEYGKSADDYKVGCADAAPSGITCPPGFFFDPVTEQCTPLGKIYPLVTPIVPPPSPPPPGPTPVRPPPIIILPPPPLGQPDPEGDEITNDLCRQMAANTSTLVFYLQQLVQQQQGGTANTGDCCAQVVAAIAGVTQALTGILSVLPSLAAPGEAPLDPVTCSQLTTLFGQLVTAWNTGNQAIVTAISGIPGPDPCVCEQLTTIANAAGTDDGTDAAYVQELVNRGILDQTLANLILGVQVETEAVIQP